MDKLPGSMRKGLVIGKFMPLHRGHLALIAFARQHCNSLVVSLSYTKEDPIPGALRFQWIQEACASMEGVQPVSTEDNFDNASLSWEERLPIWAKFIRGRFPDVNIIFSSESYGAPLAELLQIEHVSFDPDRKQIPVSATAIREHPFRHWEDIPLHVRPFFVKRVCLYGPESTGKSTLAARLAVRYNTEWVPEVAREIVTSNTFTLDDIVNIGHAQTSRVLEKQKTANKILFCDTDLITTAIYCQHYLGEVPPVLAILEKKIRYDQYFLFDIDVAWVADGLRDLGHLRQRMFSVFRDALDERKIPYIKVSGSYDERERQVRAVVDGWLQA